MHATCLGGRLQGLEQLGHYRAHDRLDRGDLLVRWERLYDARDGLEYLCLLRVLDTREARMQFAKRGDVRCERDAIRIAQIAQRVRCWQTQARFA